MARDRGRSMSTVWRYRKKNGSREGRRIISGLICSRVADAEATREYGIRTARQNRAVFAGGVFHMAACGEIAGGDPGQQDQKP